MFALFLFQLINYWLISFLFFVTRWHKGRQSENNQGDKKQAPQKILPKLQNLTKDGHGYITDGKFWVQIHKIFLFQFIFPYSCPSFFT